MTRKAEIAAELQDLQSRLAAWSSQVPFAVPEGYFDGLAERLSTGVCVAGMEDPTTSDLPQQLPYSVPESYFDTLADRLVSGVKVAQEEIVPTASLPKSLPFATPGGYFNHLAERLTAAAQEPQVPVGKELPYHVPADYFERLAENLQDAATLSSAKGRTISFVPAWRQWAGAAVAAVLLLTFSLGTYRYYDTHTPDAVAARRLSQLDANTLISYVEWHMDEFDDGALESLAPSQMQLPEISTNDIEQYLNDGGDLPSKNENARPL